MISRLDRLQGRDIYENTALAKLNEVIDAVNAIQKEREAERFEIQEWIDILEAVRKSVNIHEKQIDELQMKLEPKKCEPADPYAEQRRWIGKLCWFWNKNDKHCGILTSVFDNNKHGEDDQKEEYPFQRDSIGCWQHCEPVKPDDDIIYKGGKDGI